MIDPSIRKPFVLVIYGTSLSTGRLSTFWAERLAEYLRTFPEAVGPVIIYNMGRGSQTSVWGQQNAFLVAGLRPTHILTEGFAINDSAMGVSQASHLSNMGSMRATWKAADPNVKIIWQTMNSVDAAGASARPNLAAYYADEVTYAAAQGDGMINNYGGAVTPPGQPGGWPKPLPTWLTQDGDGLHPNQEATDAYLWPNVLFELRKQMATHWGVAQPSAPAVGPAPSAKMQRLIVGGGGGGGYFIGGGGGAGGFIEEWGELPAIGSHTVVVGSGGTAGNASSNRGGNGGNSSLLGTTALGGGGGASPFGFAANSGGSGGGGTQSGYAAGGAGTAGQGNAGGTSNGGDGGCGGGGAGAPGQSREPSKAGNGGVGRVSEILAALYSMMASGGGGGANNDSGSANPSAGRGLAGGAGAGNGGGGGSLAENATGVGNGGGGGRSSDGSGNEGGAGSIGVVAVKYLTGTMVATGGIITTEGAYTIHRFSTTGSHTFTRTS